MSKLLQLHGPVLSILRSIIRLTKITYILLQFYKVQIYGNIEHNYLTGIPQYTHINIYKNRNYNKMFYLSS